MSDRDEVDKLRILIPHWIDHNKEHAEEFRIWSRKAGNVAAKIEAAATRMETVNDALQEALLQLDGPIEFVPDHDDL